MMPLLDLEVGQQQAYEDGLHHNEHQHLYSSSYHATTLSQSRAARRFLQPPSLAVIDELQVWDSSSSVSSLTLDMCVNYNTLSTQVIWPPQGMSWPPQYASTSTSSSSSSPPSLDFEDLERGVLKNSSHSSRHMRQLQLLLISIAMVSIPIVAFVSIMQSKDYFTAPLNNDYTGDRSVVKHATPNYSYSRRHHRHFHRIVEKSRFSNVMNQTLFRSDVALNTSSIPTDTTFGDLASMIVPTYFQNTVDLCISTITTANKNNTVDVMPDGVFVVRRAILRTRDLLDVFSPVYPKKTRLLGDEKKQHTKDAGRKRKNGAKRSESDEELHKTRMNHHSVVDVWKKLRRFLNDGYTLIGDFEDLTRAKVKYTPERLNIYQEQVWNWKEEFVAFVAQNHEEIFDYLSHACQLSQLQIMGEENVHICSYHRSKSSHLFWGSTPSTQLPDGNTDKASVVLVRLGKDQLHRVQTYLREALTAGKVIGDHTINEDVHELYHNLRKEIRSFLDSVDLFGQLLLSDYFFDKHYKEITLLKEAKKLLGDLNDEVVAYSKYLEWGEFYDEQLQLRSFITVDWRDFQNWAQRVDLHGTIYSLIDGLGKSENEGSGKL